MILSFRTLISKIGAVSLSIPMYIGAGLLISICASAQTRLTGRVFDQTSQEAIIGATVLEKSTGNGTITDPEGQFSLQIHAFPVTLTVSYLGYRSQEVIIRTPEEALIGLEEEINRIHEVVVVGYGSQRRKELTGSVSSLPKATLEQPATSINELLGGSVAGLNVTQNSGQPGAGAAIRIRGGNSIYASNEPLYVIDGFIYFSEKNATQAGVGGIDSSLDPLAAINPADIESIEVLKDVSAKAIYGSRGANGVILVTTKKGNEAAIRCVINIP